MTPHPFRNFSENSSDLLTLPVPKGGPCREQYEAKIHDTNKCQLQNVAHTGCPRKNYLSEIDRLLNKTLL